MPNPWLVDHLGMPISSSNSRSQGDLLNPLDIQAKPSIVTRVSIDIAANGFTAASTSYEISFAVLNRDAVRRIVIIAADGGTIANYYTLQAWIWDSSVAKPSTNHSRTSGTNWPASLSNLGSGYGGIMGMEFAQGLGNPGDTIVFSYQNGATPNTTGVIQITVVEAFS